MKVFLDVDGVLRDLGSVCRDHHPDTDIREYENEVFGKFWTEMISTPEKASVLYLKAPVVSGALSGVRRIRTFINPVITFLTAVRFENAPWVEEYTEQWLSDHGFFQPGDTLHCVSSGKKKPAIVNKEKSVLFDDKVTTINNIELPAKAVWVESGLVNDRPLFLPGENRVSIKSLADLDAATLKFLASDHAKQRGA